MQWCRQDFQLTGSKYCFCPQNLKNPMENSKPVICFSKTDGFENPHQKIDGFSQTRRTPSDDSTERVLTSYIVNSKISTEIAGFIIFDTHMIMTRVSPEEYVIATIELYLDIINLFIQILRILSELNRK